LDEWSYNGLEALLKNATSDPSGELYKALHEPRVVFFLHLLGLDTTGHAFRPHSKEYMRNIEVVDSIVHRTEKLLDEFYAHDGKTAFVFTADHGMSNIGNHGDGGTHPVPIKCLMAHKDQTRIAHEHRSSLGVPAYEVHYQIINLLPMTITRAAGVLLGYFARM